MLNASFFIELIVYVVHNCKVIWLSLFFEKSLGPSAKLYVEWIEPSNDLYSNK